MGQTNCACRDGASPLEDDHTRPQKRSEKINKSTTAIPGSSRLGLASDGASDISWRAPTTPTLSSSWRLPSPQQAESDASHHMNLEQMKDMLAFRKQKVAQMEAEYMDMMGREEGRETTSEHSPPPPVLHLPHEHPSLQPPPARHLQPAYPGSNGSIMDASCMATSSPIPSFENGPSPLSLPRHIRT